MSSKETRKEGGGSRFVESDVLSFLRLCHSTSLRGMCLYRVSDCRENVVASKGRVRNPHGTRELAGQNINTIAHLTRKSKVQDGEHKQHPRNRHTKHVFCAVAFLVHTYCVFPPFVSSILFHFLPFFHLSACSC
jgi:hypothetical protein